MNQTPKYLAEIVGLDLSPEHLERISTAIRKAWDTVNPESSPPRVWEYSDTGPRLADAYPESFHEVAFAIIRRHLPRVRRWAKVG